MSDVALRSFEAIQVGDSASLVRTITVDDVRRFRDLTGDDNPLHVDRAYAESTAYKDIVVHGMLGASLLSTLIGTRLPGTGAVWVSQSFDFLLPVRIDDTLTVTCTVRSKNDRERLLELDAHIGNQRKQTVLTGRGAVKVLTPPAEDSTPAPARPKVAAVVGATGGIGRAICRLLAHEGYAVAVGYHVRQERADGLVEELKAAGGEALAVAVNVADSASVEAMVSTTVRRLGGLGVIVHSASPPIRPVGFDELEWSDIQGHVDADARGAFLLAKAALPTMRAQRYGRIVVVTSAVLDGAPTPKWTAYAVGKAALATLARSMAVEFGPAGINVNCVSPGMTDTAMVGDLSEKTRLVLARQTPLRRLAEPDDIAAAVAFLVSPGADYITGETLRVNGGRFTL